MKPPVVHAGPPFCGGEAACALQLNFFLRKAPHQNLELAAVGSGPVHLAHEFMNSVVWYIRVRYVEERSGHT